MKKERNLSFESIDDALIDLGAKERSHYFLCVCPSCKKDEAFMYKNNVHVIFCNRENECGERTTIRYRENVNEGDKRFYQLKREYPLLNKEQVKALDWANRAFNHIQQYISSETLDHADGYRGLSSDVTRDYIADLCNEEVVGFMFAKMKSLFDKDYSKNSFMRKRNLAFPIYGEDGSMERLLLRSSLDPLIEPKEIQLVVNPSKEARDFFVDIKESSTSVVITEGILDGLSFKEIDATVGILSLTGVKKTRQALQYLQANKDLMKSKNILIALDSDQAGREATKKMVHLLEQMNIGKRIDVFSYGLHDKQQNITDPNDFLTKDRWGFVNQYLSFLEKRSQKQRSQKVMMADRNCI